MRRVSVFVFTYSVYIAIFLFQKNTPAIQDRAPAGRLAWPKIKTSQAFIGKTLKVQLSDKKGTERRF